MNPPITELPIERIQISLANPRKDFSEAAMAELTDSIRTHGILQPLLVRLVSHADGGGYDYELVAGERRYRAAMALGLEVVPVTVKAMTAQEADEARLIENVQRADLSAIEEAEGYKRLMDDHGLSIADLCQRTGKKRATVYARLALTRMSDALREAVQQGKIEMSVAQELAKVPEGSLQDEAVNYVLSEDEYHGGDDGEPMSFRKVKAYIAATFLIDLEKAPFDPEDATLYADRSCATCPLRSGNCRDLYPDVKSPNICTDRYCYRRKVENFTERFASQELREGRLVMSAKEAAEAINDDGDPVYGSGWVRADQRCYNAKGSPTYRDALKKHKDVQFTTAIHPHTGQKVELIKEKVALEVMKKDGKLTGFASGRREIQTPEERKELILKNKIERRTVELVAAQAQRAMLGMGAHDVLAAVLGSLAGYAEQKAMDEQQTGMGSRAELVQKLADLDGIDLRTKALKAMAYKPSDGWQRFGLEALTELFELDWKMAEKQAAAELNADTKAPAKPAAKAKKGGRK